MAEGIGIGLDRVTFAYAEQTMAFDVRILASSIVAIMGASGSGKSTLLNLVAGFEAPSSGRILFGDRDLTTAPPARRPVSMVFQENNLFSHLTVEQNVGLGRSPALKLPTPTGATSRSRLNVPGWQERRGVCRANCRAANANAWRWPAFLCATGRCFCSTSPSPRSDRPCEAICWICLPVCQAEKQMTVLFVTHQPEDARKVADQVIFLESGQIAATGPAKQFFSADAPVAFMRYVGA
jgi:thiamine transport system ATP-binding protein